MQLGARFYSPATGQFMSRDPSGFGSGPNLYAYCGGDPINFFDANGCFPTSNEVATAEENFANFLRPFANFEKEAGRVAGTAIAGPVGGLIGSGGGAASMYVGLVNAYGNCGTQQGLADGGKNNSVALWLARVDVAAQTGAVGMMAGGAAMGAARGGACGLMEALTGARGFCFVAGTPVHVAPQTALASTPATGKVSKATGAVAIATKPIEQIREGTLVATRNPRTGKTEYKRVTRTFKHKTTELVALAIADKKSGKVVEVLRATPEHPFFTARGLVAAGQLGIGTELVTRAGPALVVKSIVREHHPEGVWVYNLEVEDDHTYFVGQANGGL